MIPQFIKTISARRAEKIVKRIWPYLKNKKKIIDIGCGTCNIAEILVKKGKKVTPVDVIDRSFVENLKPIIYEGKNLPFSPQHFDVSLLLMVLHHTQDPDRVFSEAVRVGKDLIVIETIYEKLFDKILTILFDSLYNLQLKPYWNSYKTDNDWKKFFKRRDYKIIAKQFHRDPGLIPFLLPYLHTVYYLKKK